MITTSNLMSVAKIIKARSKRSRVIGLTGGRSIVLVLRQLKDMGLPWRRLHFFLVDERFVPLDDKDSNYSHLRREFFDSLIGQGKFPERNLHPLNISKGINHYSKQLDNLGGRFDIAIFGVGEDGHIASLFPGKISKAKSNYVVVNDSPKPPKKRITASKKLVLKTGLGIFLFTAKEKEDAYRKFRDPEISVEDCPAKLAYHIDSVILKRW